MTKSGSIALPSKRALGMKRRRFRVYSSLWHPDSQMERWAYQELASAFERLGRYGEAAQAWAEALRFTPKHDFDRRDTENTRALNQDCAMSRLKRFSWARTRLYKASRIASDRWTRRWR